MNKKSLSARRQYSAELKARVVALCHSDEASVPEVARAHDIDVHLLRRWMRKSSPPSAHTLPQGMVPIRLEAPVAAQTDEALRLEVHTKLAQVTIHCPASRVDACARLLGTWLV